MALELLLEEAQGMSEASLMEVVRFMRFVKQENNRDLKESIYCLNYIRWIIYRIH